MYELKTVLPQFEIQLPTCMYTLKNVSLSGGADACDNNTTAASGAVPNKTTSAAATASSTSTAAAAAAVAVAVAASATATAAAAASAANAASKAMPCACALNLDVLGAHIQQILKSSNDTAAVVLRQEKVLQQLQDLKAQLSKIRSTLGVCQKGAQHTQQQQQRLNNGGLKEEPLHDIVINGHPNFIPYALLALKNAWKDLFTIDVKTFTHSTMTDIGAEARDFERKLTAVPVDATKPKITVTLIWKNCEHTEMISSPTMYVPIYGEVNIIRYLGRVGPPEYRYEDSPLCNEIDAVLDICYQLLRCTTQKARVPLIGALHARLQRQQYFGGDAMSIADIGVHTSLKRMPAITEKELTRPLTEWRKRAQLVTMI